MINTTSTVVHGVLTTILGVIAQTSLYIPGFDPQPLSVDVIGAADGVTTYQIAVGTPGDTLDGFGTGQCSDYIYCCLKFDHRMAILSISDSHRGSELRGGDIW